MADTFEYGGYHFTPYRKIRKSKDSFIKIMERVRTDRDLGLSTYEDRKADYSHAGFYEASTDKTCDLFRCEENGKIYIPCANELFEYQEPRQRGRPPAARPSAVAKLDKAKEAAAEAVTAAPAAKTDKPRDTEGR
jgi:hypothetical protein